MKTWYYAQMASDTGWFTTSVLAMNMGHARRLLAIQYPGFVIHSLEH